MNFACNNLGATKLVSAITGVGMIGGLTLQTFGYFSILFVGPGAITIFQLLVHLCQLIDIFGDFRSAEDLL